MSAQPAWWGDLPPSGPERRRALVRLAATWEQSRRLLYNPPDVFPHPKQDVFLSLMCQEALFGGAAGPGKSTALLLAALQFVDVPGYAALILRRTYVDLRLPGALMDVADRWLRGTDARWSAMEKEWTFPSGATLTFGHLEHEAAKYRYQSAEFQFIGWDELTQFTEGQYTFLFSRLRRPSYPRGGSSLAGVSIKDVPLRMRSASNPGGDGHDWVRSRFVDPETRQAGAFFVPARMHENPSLDQAEYLKALAELSPGERDRLIQGDWDAVDTGGMFAPEEWPVLERRPEYPQAVRVWDLAGSEPTAAYPDPDYSVGLLLMRDPHTGQCCVADVARFRTGPAETEARIAAVADDDGRQTPVVIEQEPGSAGIALISRYSRHVLRGKASVHAFRPTGDKATRARPVSAAAGRRELSLVRAPWLREFASELRRFPTVRHDDQVDALSAAYDQIGRVSTTGRASVARTRLPASPDERRMG